MIRECRDCQYFRATERAEGECRFYAPRPSKVEGKKAFWPIVNGDDGCGEYTWAPGRVRS